MLELKHVRKAYGRSSSSRTSSLHIERGDRIALVGPNGAGKSTLMRMLSGVGVAGPRRAPSRPPGRHRVLRAGRGHAARSGADGLRGAVVRLARCTWCPPIRNILGGFLFSGDDIYKKCGVLSGGERTRLAVARMLLRPSNLLLLDEPTNHLDLDSKDVLLDALVDYGGTLIFVSHDRYFVERLATRIIEIGGGRAESFPGTYPEFLWRKEHLHESAQAPEPRRRRAAAGGGTARREDRSPPGSGEGAQGRRESRPRAAEARAGRTAEARSGEEAAPGAADRPRDPHRGARGVDSDPRNPDVGAQASTTTATPRSRPSRATRR